MNYKSERYRGSKALRNLPYSLSLTPNTDETLGVLIGSGAWDRAKSSTWFKGRKVVMPSGQNPSAFNWTVARGFHDSIIWSFGRQPTDRLVSEIASQLLAYHSRVLLMHEGTLIACYNPMEGAA